MTDQVIEMLETEIRDLHEKISTREMMISDRIDHLLAAHKTDTTDLVSYLGWVCPETDNAIGHCVYDLKGHGGEDECIFCGAPHERK
jgi:hypothetical protein